MNDAWFECLTTAVKKVFKCPNSIQTLSIVVYSVEIAGKGGVRTLWCSDEVRLSALLSLQP